MRKPYVYTVVLAVLTIIYTYPMQYKQMRYKQKKIAPELSNVLLVRSLTTIKKRMRYKTNLPHIKKTPVFKSILTKKRKRKLKKKSHSLKVKKRNKTKFKYNEKLPLLEDHYSQTCENIYKSKDKIKEEEEWEEEDEGEDEEKSYQNTFYKKRIRKQSKRRFSSLPKLERMLSTNSMLIHVQKRKKIKYLQNRSTIDFKIYEGTKRRAIYGIMGVVLLFDLRGFTYFCNKTKNLILPINFMANLSEKLDEIIYKWDGEVISRTGDGFVALFPKTKQESNYKKCLDRAYKSSIELAYKTDKFLQKQNLAHAPKKFGMGIEIGTTLIFKNKRFSKLTPISCVASTINNTQRYEQHSKELLRKWKDYKPTVMPERLYMQLPKKMQKTFKTKNWYLKGQREYYKQPFSQKGITEKMFVCSAPFEKIKEFYKKNIHIFKKKKRKFTSHLHEILDL